MLVVSRKDRESIELSGGIRIVVVEARNGKVKLGIDAPPEIEVYRTEVIERVIEPFSHYTPEFIAKRTRIPLELVLRRMP